jgi:hypothetical protein
MMIKPSRQAIGLNDDGPLTVKTPTAPRISPDRRAAPGPSTPRDTSPRHPTDTDQDTGDMPMEYQQGFFSGPSG